MKKSLWRLALAGGVAATLTVMDAPAMAGSTTIPDASGFDFDAGCVVSVSGLMNPLASPPAANSYKSPAGAGCGGGTVSTYDGSAESLDIRSVTMSNVGNRLKAAITVDGPIPAPGSTNRAHSAFDLIDNNFQGGGFRVLFNNTDKQTNGDNTNTGCARLDGGRVRDQQGHWKDGYHSFLSYDVTWDGTRWVHSAQIGDYTPGPDGGFVFNELGTNNGSGWVDAIPEMAGRWAASKTGTGPSVLNIEVEGILRTSDTLCVGGVHQSDYASTNPGPYSTLPHTGDHITNVKALATADQTVTLPVTVPLSVTCGLPGDLVCENDLTSIGGFVFFVDWTAGASKPGRLNTNIKKISYSGGFIGGTDTLGPGPNCPTSTFGGTLPNNPLWVANQNQGCHIDDEMIPNEGGGSWKGTFFSELWPTNYSFIFS